MASIGELFIELGVQADTQTIDKVGNGIKSLRTNLLLVAGAFTGAIIGLDRFINSALNGVVSLQNLNKQTDLSIEKIQRFQQAARLSNLSLNDEQIAQSIAQVEKNLNNLQRFGEGDISGFQLAGINIVGQDVFSIIEQLRNNIRNLDSSTATNIIERIGFSREFINVLRLSREEFDKLSENVFLSGKQRADIDKLGTSITALKLRFKALKDQAIAKISPDLNNLVDRFFKWIKDNGDKIVETISSIANGFSSFAVAVGNSFNLLGQFLERIIGMQNGINILAGAFAFLTLSFSPFLAGLTAIILLLDDIAVFRQGGKSLIGGLVEGFEKLPNLAKIFGGAVVVSSLISPLKGITKAIIGMVTPAVMLATPLASIVGSLTFLSKSSDIGKFLANKIDNTKIGRNFFDSLFGSKETDILGQKGLEFLRTPQGQNTFNNTYNINGVQNPQEIAGEIRRTVTNQQEELNRINQRQQRLIR